MSPSVSPSRAWYLAVCLCLLPLADANLPGQILTSSAPDVPFRIHKRVEEVRVLFNVADKHGRPIVNLEPQDVVVVDDGQPVSSFTDFSRPTVLPRLTMLVDASASMAGNFLAERAAAQRMLNVGSGASAAVVPWTTLSREMPKPEKRRLSNWRFPAVLPVGGVQPDSLSGLHPSGATAMLDALSIVMQRPPSSAEKQSVRRVILLLSDGEDNTSRHTLEEVLEVAQRKEVAIYAVDVHNPHLEFPGDRVLRSLCEGTGGRFFLFPNYSNAESALVQIESDLRSGYAVSFHPRVSSRDDREHAHSLSIKIRNHRHLRVQMRKSYYLSAGEPFP